MIELFHVTTGEVSPMRSWAALIEDGRLLGVSREGRPDRVQPGEVHLGLLRSIDRNRGVAFAALENGEQAMLDLPRTGPRLVEGEALLLQIRRATRDEKMAKATLRIRLETSAVALTLAGPLGVTTVTPEPDTSHGGEVSIERAALQSMAERILAAARTAVAPKRVCAARAPVADLLFRFPDARPDLVRCDTRVAAETLARAFDEDPVGHGIRVEYEPAREWRYGLRDLLELVAESMNNWLPLPGGGSLLIEPCRTLTAIDVNAGGASSSSGAERVAIEVNRVAAREIATLVRCRNLAGNVVVDFIGMRAGGERHSLVDRLRAAFAADPARPWIGGMSPIGLVEMSRRVLGAGPVEWPVDRTGGA